MTKKKTTKSDTKALAEAVLSCLRGKMAASRVLEKSRISHQALVVTLNSEPVTDPGILRNVHESFRAMKDAEEDYNRACVGLQCALEQWLFAVDGAA